MRRPNRALIALVLTALLAAACGGGAGDGDAVGGLRQVSVTSADDLRADPPGDLVILDVRTPEEFSEGHLEGATMIDFYRDDFAEQLAGLDPDVPYLLYCRSGNRSGQTIEIMRELGFTDVADIDGGINAWNAAGLPVVTP